MTSTFSLPKAPDKTTIIPLWTSNGTGFVIDAEDSARTDAFDWFVHPAGHIWGRHRRMTTWKAWVHRLVLDAPNGIEVDHKNGYPADNSKSNLRFATRSQQIANRRKEKKRKTSSRFKGVTWNKRNKNWMAQIKVDQKHIYLGSFEDEEQAAKAYDRTAMEVFGEFAHTNF